MNDENTHWSNKYDSWKTKKSSEELAEVLRGKDRDDIEIATQLLLAEYQTKIKGYVSKKLPYDWVEDVTQEIWRAFYNYVRAEGVKKSVSSLLWTIARNKRADAVDRHKRETEIEGDIPLKEFAGRVERDYIEEYIEKKQLLQMVSQIPFSIPLSPCQRIVLVLRVLCGLPSAAVATLMGKSIGSIDSHFYNIKEKLKQYLRSEDYYLSLASRESNTVKDIITPTNLTLGIERFASPLTPNLSSDVLRTLGCTDEEYRTDYIVSLATLKWGNRFEPEDQTLHPYLLFTKRRNWDTMHKLLLELSRIKSETGQLDATLWQQTVVEDYYAAVDVSDDNKIINLRPWAIISLYAKQNVKKVEYDDMCTYVSYHSPNLTVPYVNFIQDVWRPPDHWRSPEYLRFRKVLWDEK